MILYSVFKERPRDTPLQKGDVRVQCSECQRVAERRSALPRAPAQTAEVLGCCCAPVRGRNLATIAWLPRSGQRAESELSRSARDDSAFAPSSTEGNARRAGLLPARRGRDRAPGG